MKTCPSCGTAIESNVTSCTCGFIFASVSSDSPIDNSKRKEKGRALDYWGIFLSSFAYLMITRYIQKSEWEGLIHYIPQAVGVALIPFLFLYFMSRKAGWIACAVLTLLALSNTFLEVHVLKTP